MCNDNLAEETKKTTRNIEKLCGNRNTHFIRSGNAFISAFIFIPENSEAKLNHANEAVIEGL